MNRYLYALIHPLRYWKEENKRWERDRQLTYDKYDSELDIIAISIALIEGESCELHELELSLLNEALGRHFETLDEMKQRGI